MSRQLIDWIDSYMEYTEDTESPTLFHSWAALFAISSALRKKVKLQYGRFDIYPNLYIVLVGPPGSRKSQAISYAEMILNKVSDVFLIKDATTPEAFIQALAASGASAILPDGRPFMHNSVSVISREFEIFLGQKANNGKMLVYLTDFWDCPENFTYRVKHGGSDTISSAFLSILGATTPESLGNTLSQSSIGGGFTSRIVFVYCQKRTKKIAIPKLTPRVIELRELLIKDLFTIARLTGTWTLAPDAEEYWTEWYNKYEDIDPKRACTDASFNGWYERKPIMIMKVALCCSAARSDERLIQIEDINRAERLLMGAEKVMAGAFTGVGRSPLAADIDMVMNVIRGRGTISEMELQALIWKDVDAQKFKIVLSTLLSGGLVKRSYTKAANAIWYEWAGGK